MSLFLCCVVFSIKSGSSGLSRRREHRSAASSCGDGHFLLHDIPMLNDFAVLHFENIYGDKRFRPPAYIASVNHHQIALRDNHTYLVGEILKRRNQIGDRPRSVWDDWIVLDIVRGEVPVHNG